MKDFVTWEVRTTGVKGEHLGYVRALTRAYAQRKAVTEFGTDVFVRQAPDKG